MGGGSSALVRRPDKELLQEYRCATMSQLNECLDILKDVMEWKRYLDREEFDVVFGLLLRDTEEHFHLFNDGYGSCDAFQVFCGTVIVILEDLSKKIKFLFQLVAHEPDSEHDRALSRNQVDQLLGAVCGGARRLVGKQVPTERILKGLVDDLFMDVRDDLLGVIFMPDFQQWALNTPAVLLYLDNVSDLTEEVKLGKEDMDLHAMYLGGKLFEGSESMGDVFRRADGRELNPLWKRSLRSLLYRQYGGAVSVSPHSTLWSLLEKVTHTSHFCFPILRREGVLLRFVHLLDVLALFMKVVSEEAAGDMDRLMDSAALAASTLLIAQRGLEEPLRSIMPVLRRSESRPLLLEQSVYSAMSVLAETERAPVLEYVDDSRFTAILSQGRVLQALLEEPRVLCGRAEQPLSALFAPGGGGDGDGGGDGGGGGGGGGGVKGMPIVPTLSEDALLLQAFMEMDEAGLPAVAVVDEDDRLLRVVSLHDFPAAVGLAAASAKDAPMLKPISSFAPSPFVTAVDSEALLLVLVRMSEADAAFAVIVDDGGRARWLLTIQHVFQLLL